MRKHLALTLAAAVGAAHAGPFEDRERDWRNGAIVYQIIVDRFVPSANLEAKRALYPAPKQLRAWTETPQPGPYLAGQKLSAHELDFWGDDLASAISKLDHVQQLGADVRTVCWCYNPNPRPWAATTAASACLNFSQHFFLPSA